MAGVKQQDLVDLIAVTLNNLPKQEFEVQWDNQDYEFCRIFQKERMVVDGGPMIERKNRQRYVTVGANVHGRSLGEGTVDARRMVEAMEIPEGVRVSFGGQIREQQDAFQQR